ncbi:MAG: endonuclease III [Candidatus Gracilibacteria bacterium]|nr:endonuclease III [Candidatus Gracilibacteria bacterium]
MKKITQKYLADTLDKMYPNAKTELNYNTEFQLLCAVMWSAQTTDVQVNKATSKFFDNYKTPEDAIKIGLEKLTQNISTLGFYKTKARHAMQTAEILIEKYNSKVPRDFDELISLPGVGIKTTKVVLAVLDGAHFLPVDTHVHRVLNRLGFVETKTPEQTDKLASNMFTTQNLAKLHHTIILFGRYFCTAKKPKCEENCPFKSGCKYYNSDK